MNHGRETYPRPHTTAHLKELRHAIPSSQTVNLEPRLQNKETLFTQALSPRQVVPSYTEVFTDTSIAGIIGMPVTSLICGTHFIHCT